MQTKRKQTLLAGAGLLTALTLTMTACTPSKFTPGPSVPTQPNTPAQSGTNAPAVTTISGNASFLGTAFANADIRLTNLYTGNVIATGGGNTKTDANGNFSVTIPGLTESDVVRVDATNGEETLSAMMTGNGFNTNAKAPSSYAVAATEGLQLTLGSTTVVQSVVGVNGATQGQGDSTSKTRRVLQPQGLFGIFTVNFTGVITRTSTYWTRFAVINYQSNLFFNNNVGGLDYGRRIARGQSTALQQVVKESGVSSILRETLTEAFVQIAKTDIKLAQSFNGQPLSSALPDSEVKIEGNNITLNGQTFDLGNPNTPSQPNNPVPTVEETQETKNQLDVANGHWVHDGWSPTVTIGDNYVEVTQGKDQPQMVSMTVLLPKALVSGVDGVGDLSGANLTGTVTGSTRAGTPRAGTLTFSALTGSTGTITLGSFGQIGTYTVTEEGAAWKIKMLYTYNESGIEAVGEHTTRVTATNLSRLDDTNKGMAIVIAGVNASSRVQF